MKKCEVVIGKEYLLVYPLVDGSHAICVVRPLEDVTYLHDPHCRCEIIEVLHDPTASDLYFCFYHFSCKIVVPYSYLEEYSN